MEGELECTGCARTYPIIRGVPRILPSHLIDPEWHARTIVRFGKEWQLFSEVELPFYEKQFLSFIHPVQPSFFEGKVVLDAGCGKGRHVRLAARWGARVVLGIDLSEAVEVSFAHTHHLPNVHIIQGDIFHLPLQPGKVDYAYSVGVIHHTPDPARAIQSIARILKKGGALSVWVYGRENNGWIIYLINPLRRFITSRLPSSVLMVISFILAIPLYLLSRTLYRGRLFKSILPYFDYIHHLSEFSFREIHSIVYDHLTPSIAFYLSREEFQSYWRKAGIEPELHWRNRNSWCGFGTVAESVSVSWTQEVNA